MSTPAAPRTHAARYWGDTRTAYTWCGRWLTRAKLVPRNQATCLACYPRTIVLQPTEHDDLELEHALNAEGQR